ncbi:MAG: hypothetical protein HAW58_03335 [Candidatus Thioglobus sp.]|nr:hypothetical protein [Candidatus Thioglobus sp.]
MNFKPETLRLFIGIFVSGAGILLFNFVRISFNPSSKLSVEMMFSVAGTVLLLAMVFILLKDLFKKGG